MEGGWGRGTTADKSAEGRADIILMEGLMKSMRVIERPVIWSMKGLIKG